VCGWLFVQHCDTRSHEDIVSDPSFYQSLDALIADGLQLTRDKFLSQTRCDDIFMSVEFHFSMLSQRWHWQTIGKVCHSESSLIRRNYRKTVHWECGGWCWSRDSHGRVPTGSWKSFNFLLLLSRPGKSLKTSQVLESPWISSLKLWNSVAFSWPGICLRWIFYT